MAANKIVTFPPVAIPTTTGNLYSPGTTTGGTNMPENVANLYFLFRHLRVTNRTNAAIVFGLYLSTTADATDGRQVIWGATSTGGPPTTTITAGTGVSVAAQSYVEWFGLLRIAAADTNKFLTGIAGGAGLIIEGEGEIGIV